MRKVCSHATTLPTSSRAIKMNVRQNKLSASRGRLTLTASLASSGAGAVKSIWALIQFRANGI